MFKPSSQYLNPPHNLYTLHTISTPNKIFNTYHTFLKIYALHFVHCFTFKEDKFASISWLLCTGSTGHYYLVIGRERTRCPEVWSRECTCYKYISGINKFEFDNTEDKVSNTKLKINYYY